MALSELGNWLTVEECEFVMDQTGYFVPAIDDAPLQTPIDGQDQSDPDIPF